ncbi:MAG: hypothetical protein VKO21_09155 [Candidatus Sericytochromatia bacterium]|nr:hypothetical protein [Candidatus Sericytochromatia bacterium]
MRLFIGREQILAEATKDLAGPPGIRAVNLHGPGGIGKTTLKAILLERLETIAPETARLTLDETCGRLGLPDALEAMADGFRPPRDLPLPGFTRLRHALAVLRRLRGRLATEDAPEIIQAGLEAALSAVADPSDPSEAARRPALEAAVQRWTRDREEQDFLRAPMRVLATALRDDLREGLRPPASGWERLLLPPSAEAPARVLLVLDSHEALHPALGSWLLAWFLPLLDAPGSGLDLRLLVCGRLKLRDTDPLRRWDGWSTELREFDLERFTLAETKTYLAARGIDTQRAPEALEASRGLPFLLCLWCDTDGRGRGLALQQAARRIRWWKSDSEIRWMEAAAYLGPLSVDALELILEEPEEAAPAFHWLTTHAEALAHDDAGELVLSPVVAGILRDALRQESPRRAELLERAGRAARELMALERTWGPSAPEWAALALGPDLGPSPAGATALRQGLALVMEDTRRGEDLRLALDKLWARLPAERQATLLHEASRKRELWRQEEEQRQIAEARRTTMAIRAEQLARRAEELRQELVDLERPDERPEDRPWWNILRRRPPEPAAVANDTAARIRQTLEDLEMEITRCRAAATT